MENVKREIIARPNTGLVRRKTHLSEQLDRRLSVILSPVFFSINEKCVPVLISAQFKQAIVGCLFSPTFTQKNMKLK